MEDFDYRDSFLKFTPKNVMYGVMYATIIVICGFVLSFSGYIIVCFMDRNPPIENMVYRADDAKIGGSTTVHLSFFRARTCEFSFIRMATDAKGRVVYQKQEERLVNGPIRPVDIVDEYPIAANAAPGQAVMHLFAFWKCPGNLIHKIYPIQKEYTDTFNISLNETGEDLSEMALSDAEKRLAYVRARDARVLAERERIKKEQEQSTASERQ